MKPIFSVLYYCYILQTISADRLACPSNEVFDSCKSPCEASCQRPNPPVCKFLVCRLGCVCRPGTVRDESTGRCIPRSYCNGGGGGHQRVCPDGEIPTDDILKCEPTCQPHGKFQGYQCVTHTGWCICQPGLVRDPKSGKCVPINSCQRDCGLNEVWSDCTNPVCRPTCQKPTPQRFCPQVCQPGCTCRIGYIWDEECHQCIPEDECPEDEKECGENEEWKQCSDVSCRRTCKNMNDSIQCRKICKPGCSCKNGYVWDDEDHKCVLPKACPLQCGENEEWKMCSNVNCRETCQRRKPKKCAQKCEPGCSCKSGYIWDEAREKCVLRRECSKFCDKNEEWCEYVPDDLPTCQTLLKPKCHRCGNGQPSFVSLRSGCICIEGYIWDEESEKCISLDQCLKGSSDSTSTTTAETTSSTESTSSTSSGVAEETTESSTCPDIEVTECATSPSSSTSELITTSSSSSTGASTTESRSSTEKASTVSIFTEVTWTGGTPGSNSSEATSKASSAASEATSAASKTPASESSFHTSITSTTTNNPTTKHQEKILKKRLKKFYV